MRKTYNLIFFAHPRNRTLKDFTEAATLVSAAHPDIHAVALSSRQRLAGMARLVGLAARPTLSDAAYARHRLHPRVRDRGAFGDRKGPYGCDRGGT